MIKTNISVISDDMYLRKGLVSLMDGMLPEFPLSVLFLDLDRFGELATLEGRIAGAPSADLVIGISRDGIVSRLLSRLPSVSADAPLRQIADFVRGQCLYMVSQSFWLAECQAVRTGQRLTRHQRLVLAGFRKSLNPHSVARIAGLHPKTCYSHVRALCNNLNLKNITELRSFAIRISV